MRACTQSNPGLGENKMLNRCEFIGNVGREPEIRAMQSGDKVANISIACTEKWRDKSTGDRKERTVWVPVVIWGGMAKIVEQYVRKGSKIYVSGQFEVRKWQDQSGNDRYSTEIVLRPFSGTILLLDGRRDGDGGGSGGDYGGNDGGGGGSGYGAGGRPGGDDPSDEIPFIMEWRI
jgi:single-strand DNA-binding protein